MSTAVVLRCTPRRRYTALARYATCQAIRTLLNWYPLRNRTPVLGTNYLELESNFPPERECGSKRARFLLNREPHWIRILQ